MSANSNKQKLGLPRLTAIVFGSVVGMGIFDIAQNLASSAGVGAVAISWVITAIGMLFLVLTFKVLADHRPDLKAGIYQYARTGFGDYAGFNIAWGYWLCTAFGNVAYAVMLNDAVGAFFPPLLEHGWATIAACSLLIWMMFFVVSRGIRTATYINLVMTIVKLITIAMILVLLVIFFRTSTFTVDIWGKSLGSFVDQVKSTMMMTLWCFIGLEGAIVMSSRARRQSDVGRAGLIGFILSWVLYLMISLFCFGVMSQAEIANLHTPSLAYVLTSVCGEWVYYFVILAVIISLAGSWLAWTLICSQVPYEAAGVGIFPKMFLRTNNDGTPITGLIVSTITMQLFILLVVTANSVYKAAAEMTGMMVLPAYLFCGLFLLKAAFNPGRFLPDAQPGKLLRYKFLGIMCVIFCLWTIYAGGPQMLLATSLFYLPGVYFYCRARRDADPTRSVFTRQERYLLAFFIVAAIVSAILIATGDITFNV